MCAFLEFQKFSIHRGYWPKQARLLWEHWTYEEMGDHLEPRITPETPGEPSIRNPFESPNDYLHLREPLVPSTFVFKLSQTAPSGFNWSIDDMASLHPVHIDQEEIQRQSFYLSQTRIDLDIEEKRQNAIEQFFTKGTIVPSPWALSETHRDARKSKTWSLSPMKEETEKKSVACQTRLSLPVSLDLRELLGEYYRNEESGSDSSQESLSSSSLRRKLFLDGQGSLSSSDNSCPPSPEKYNSRRREERSPSTQGKVFVGPASIFSSPLSCGVSASTPSTGQFSSSPILTGCFRDCSSISPLFTDGSSRAGAASPTVSPIVARTMCTPTGSGNLPFSVPLDVDVPSFTLSPGEDGCAPIHGFSPQRHHTRVKHKPRFRSCITPPPICPFLDPRLPYTQEADDPLSLLLMEPDDSVLPSQNNSGPDADRLCLAESVKIENSQETRMEGKLEDEGDGGGLSGRMTSSRMGNMSVMESSQMFTSLLAERSSIRYDSSMQVDSGYQTTTTGTGSLIDGLVSEYHGKESFSTNLAEDVSHLTKAPKVWYPHH
ncbi:protein aurora borealis isoform X2 [Corythoichthys intestinalis]|uniref:protein aurora borealis isoform X2 n=1 Tax=Corythoichthys intestinalis TaxID=161448 RepID=UPI0025A4E759|nr:protein aurora borealis isoform X2 [Corythoichthys intestinalis]